MALTVTAAGASSDSYATLVEADAFLAWKVAAGAAAEWDALSDANKEALLKGAVQYLDRGLWTSAKYDTDTPQALRFPSVYHTDSAGDAEVREHIKKAQVYLALHMLDEPEQFTGGSVDSVSVAGSFSVKMGNGSDNSGTTGLPIDVLEWMRPEMVTAGGGSKVWSSAGRGWV